jgi:hypothetical protein
LLAGWPPASFGPSTAELAEPRDCSASLLASLLAPFGIVEAIARRELNPDAGGSILKQSTRCRRKTFQQTENFIISLPVRRPVQFADFGVQIVAGRNAGVPRKDARCFTDAGGKGCPVRARRQPGDLCQFRQTCAIEDSGDFFRSNDGSRLLGAHGQKPVGIARQPR